jgi:protease-4
METFTSGAFKDSLSGARPMRDDERAYVQNLVNQMYDRFLGIVADARQLPKDQLKVTVADGRVVTGREALAAKLVDQIGYIEDAYVLARDLGKAPNAMVVKYRTGSGFLDALGLAAAKAAAEPGPKVEIDITGGLKPHLQPGVLYYLPSLFAR